MPLTLGKLKQFCSDNASSMGDGSADRVLVNVVQNALRRLDRAHNWDHLRARARLRLESQVAITGAINAVQGSRVFTLTSGALEQRFVEQEWDLVLADNTLLIFQIQALENPRRALARPGQVWTGAAVVDGDATLYRSRHVFPFSLKTVFSATLLEQDYELGPLSVPDFERYRRSFLTSSGQPIYYSVRGQAVEFWPLPDSSTADFLVELDYQRHVLVPEDAADDEELVDWPDELRDLLQAACKIELVSKLKAESVPFDPGRALQDYNELVTMSKATVERRVFRPQSMGLRGSARRMRDPSRDWPVIP